MGNCGVGFAPVAPDFHDGLIEMMEGVEDIPGTALHEGLQWNWETFPEFLNALDGQERTIDVETHVPHAALRATSWASAEEILSKNPRKSSWSRWRKYWARVWTLGRLVFPPHVPSGTALVEGKTSERFAPVSLSS
jgi:hypothetical protein